MNDYSFAGGVFENPASAPFWLKLNLATMKKPLCQQRAQRLCEVTFNSPHQGERSDGSDEGVVVPLADKLCGERNSITPGAMQVTWT